MPFQYHFSVPILPDQSKVTFQAWLIDERSPVFPGTAVATIECAGKLYRVLANGEGFLWKKLVKHGDKLKEEDALGMIAADGENIPYGKPYSLLEAV